MATLESISHVNVQNAFTGEYVPLSTLWQDRPVVLSFFRRFGCKLCRHGAMKLSSLKPALDAMGVDLVAIGFETIGLQEFVNGDFFKGSIYLDLDRICYKNLQLKRPALLPGMAMLLFDKRVARQLKEAGEVAFGGFKGDGMQMGATFVIDKGGQVTLAHKQEYFGEMPELTDILKACTECASVKARPETVALSSYEPSWDKDGFPADMPASTSFHRSSQPVNSDEDSAQSSRAGSPSAEQRVVPGQGGMVALDQPLANTPSPAVVSGLRRSASHTRNPFEAVSSASQSSDSRSHSSNSDSRLHKHVLAPTNPFSAEIMADMGPTSPRSIASRGSTGSVSTFESQRLDAQSPPPQEAAHLMGVLASTSQGPQQSPIVSVRPSSFSMAPQPQRVGYSTLELRQQSFLSEGQAQGRSAVATHRKTAIARDQFGRKIPLVKRRHAPFADMDADAFGFLRQLEQASDAAHQRRDSDNNVPMDTQLSPTFENMSSAYPAVPDMRRRSASADFSDDTSVCSLNLDGMDDDEEEDFDLHELLSGRMPVMTSDGGDIVDEDCVSCVSDASFSLDARRRSNTSESTRHGPNPLPNSMPLASHGVCYG